MKKLFLIAVISIFMVGCSTTTQFIKGETDVVWTIKSKSDAIVSYENKAGEKFTVDNRGRPSPVELILGVAAGTLTDIDLQVGGD